VRGWFFVWSFVVLFLSCVCVSCFSFLKVTSVDMNDERSHLSFLHAHRSFLYSQVKGVHMNDERGAPACGEF